MKQPLISSPNFSFFSSFGLTISKMVIKISTHKVVVILKREIAWQMISTSNDGNFKGAFVGGGGGQGGLKMSCTSSLTNSRMKQCFWVTITKYNLAIPSCLPSLTLKSENLSEMRNLR